jgi:hypothetical protein
VDRRLAKLEERRYLLVGHVTGVERRDDPLTKIDRVRPSDRRPPPVPFTAGSSRSESRIK